MGCGCNKNIGNSVPSASPVSQAMFQMELSKKPDFKQVIYNGPSYSHLVPSRTGVIAKLGMRDYGVGKKGSTLFVHIDDITAYPTLYQLVEQPQIAQQENISLPETEIKKVLDLDATEIEEALDLEVPEIEEEISEKDVIEILQPKKTKKRKG